LNKVKYLELKKPQKSEAQKKGRGT
jgi:hypothetical protein